ncbi:hypothetical protein BRC83_09490 [Halobacteriales archaeon QS_1_68_17]|nr:MAG: hypothetical protein BRC83_09490 [Halobacteriales archaeon QS_1_68_17]
MPPGGFGPGDAVNRRVNSHLRALLPGHVSSDRDYYFEGQRTLPPERIPGGADEGICFVEAYVGTDGQFAIYEEREFGSDEAGGWRCENRITRRRSEGVSSLDPFEYAVRTAVEIGGRTRTDRSAVEWPTLGADPIYGGIETQAAALLAEKMAHRKVHATTGYADHCGSLSRVGSLSRAIDSSHYLPVDWTDVDALLGPDADTIASSVGFEGIDSERRCRRARERGVDFLAEDLEAKLRAVDVGGTDSGDEPSDPAETRPPWTTLPADVDPETAAARIGQMHRRIVEMRHELQRDP